MSQGGKQAAADVVVAALILKLCVCNRVVDYSLLVAAYIIEWWIVLKD